MADQRTARCRDRTSIAAAERGGVSCVHCVAQEGRRFTATAVPEQEPEHHSEHEHEVLLRCQQQGEIVGRLSAGSGRPFPVDAVTFDACETLQVERNALLARLNGQPLASSARA